MIGPMRYFPLLAVGWLDDTLPREFPLAIPHASTATFAFPYLLPLFSPSSFSRGGCGPLTSLLTPPRFKKLLTYHYHLQRPAVRPLLRSTSPLSFPSPAFWPACLLMFAICLFFCISSFTLHSIYFTIAGFLFSIPFDLCFAGIGYGKDVCT